MIFLKYLCYDVYNNFFGTNVSATDTSEFKERTIVFKNYGACRGKSDEPLYTRTYKVVGLSATNNFPTVVSDSEFKFLRQYDVYTFGLYFTDIENCSGVYALAENTPLYTTNQSFEAIYQVVGVVEIFKEYFSVFAIIIAIIGLLVLVSYHAGNLKSRRYDIGVLRSLGCKARDVGKIFFLQSLLIGIVTSLLFVSGTVMLTDLVNEILVESFKTYIDSPAIQFLNQISILEISGAMLLVDIAFLMIISALSSVAPLLRIRKIKPISIVKSRE